MHSSLRLSSSCALLAGCGGDDDESADNPAPPVAKPEDFPRANGKTLAQLREGLGPGGPGAGARRYPS